MTPTLTTLGFDVSIARPADPGGQAMNRQTLVAIDRNGRADAAQVESKLGDALLAHTQEDGVHRFDFDAHQIRNTVVHSWGWHAGFLVHIEYPDDAGTS